MTSPIFDLSFWFALFPNGLSPVYSQIFFFLFSGFVIVGSIARMVARNKKADPEMKKVYFSIARMFFVMGILGLVWFFFTYELVYFLGARFWFLLWIAGVAGWIGWIVYYTKKKAPALQAEREKQAAFNAYLPRSNRRS
ncbi:MAG: hypothetical protein WCT24_02300 [Patescibacteria group bacterium]|jgi:hypothetical protein